MELFTKSEHFKPEYACEVVRIGQVTPISGSDFLGVVEIHPGMPIVVRKDLVREGDVMFYVDTECQLNKDFLRINNQFEDSSMNADPNQTGYINKYGRVRMMRLRGQESMGYLFSEESMNNYLYINKLPMFGTRNPLDLHVGEVFDTINNERFVKAYVPPATKRKGAKRKGGTTQKSNQRDKKLKRFYRIIPNTFSFHYDTGQLEKNIHRFEPDDVVDISVKLHGTSAVFAHIPVRRQLTFFEKVKKFFGFKVQLTEYDHIYSSHSVIKNQYINRNVTPGYYKVDVWRYWNALIKEYIPKDTTIYGEIVGFTPIGSCIQKDYDYGCAPGMSKLMIYRINTNTDDGKSYEWNVGEVKQWTENLINVIKKDGDEELADRIHPIDVLWHGTLHQLFPDIPVDQDWGSAVVHALANKKDWHMEESEPLCNNKVPREGIVIRKYNDPLKEVFKLKTIQFKRRERGLVDEGYVDTEMAESEY